MTARAPARLAWLILPLALAAGGARAAAVLDESEALRISQAALGQRLGDHRFRDTEGLPVRLADFRGKPLVINMVYTGCADVCPVVVQTLYDAVEAGQAALGADSFAVATIGFDARHDTPARMRAYAREQGVDLPNWRFLSADGATVERLAEELGFVIYPSAGGFDHMAQTTVLDQEGVVRAQIYGGGFPVPQLVEPLRRLLLGQAVEAGTLAALIEQVRLICTIYDPKSGRYRFDYSVIIGAVIGIACLSGVALFLVREWRRPPRSPA